MALILTSGPSVEPLTLDEAKAHLRLDGTNEDALIASLILTSRLHIEAALGLALVTQTWRLQIDAWPECEILELPIRPLQSVSVVRIRDRDGNPVIVAATDYALDTASSPPRIAPVNAGWPIPGKKLGGIEIDFSAGYGNTAASVPQPIRQALLLLVAHWYEHRDPIEIGSQGARVPTLVSDLLLPYRMVRI